MGFSIDTNSMKRLSTYENAEKWFNEIGPRKSRRWQSDERPLRDTRSTHLALRQTEHLGVPCYDLVLYQTPLIRYFKPNQDGERAIWLQNYPSQSTQKFMWAHGWSCGTKMLDQNDKVCRVIATTQTRLASELWGDEFTCKMVFDANNKLIRSKSAHLPIFRRSSTATMRARRKTLKQKIDVMLAMLEMQFTSLIGETKYDIWQGRDIGAGAPHFPLIEHAMRGVQMLEKGGNPDDDDLTRLVEYMKFSAKQVIENTINRRLYSKYADRYRWHRLLEGAPDESGRLSDLTQEQREMAVPTAEEVIKGVAIKVMNMAGLHADMRVPMPQFPAEIPRTMRTSGNSEDIVNLLGGVLYHKLISRKGEIY